MLSGFVPDKITGTILAVAAIILAVSLILCYYLQDNHGAADDVLNFYNFAELIKSGQLPYKDFVFEFPPFALVFFLIPSMFTSDMMTYVTLYGIEVAIITLITLAILLKFARRIEINRCAVAIVFMSFVLFYFYHAIRKFDMSTLMLTVAALYLYSQQKRTAAYAVMTVGAFTKMYPGLLAFVFLIIDLARDRDIKGALKGIGISIVTGFAIILPLLLLSVSFTEITSFLTFHIDRGFQIESFIAVIIQGLAQLGYTTVEYVGVNYTYDVTGPLCTALLPYWTALSTIAVLAILGLIAVHAYKTDRGNIERNKTRDLIIYSTAVIIMFLLMNKVFSTQYIIWLYGFFTIFAVKYSTKINWISYIISLCVIFLSTWIVVGTSFDSDFVPTNLLRDILLSFILANMILFMLGKRNIFGSLYEAPISS